MTQELTSHQLSNDVDSIDDRELLADDDSGMASMLSDAYDAPPAPKTLVRRLDDGIQQRWGYSPKLVSSRFAGAVAVARVGKTLVRSWPVAASLAASLLLVLFLAGGSDNYAWATVVDAIKRHGLIQINETDGTCWLDLSKQIAGQKNDHQIRWIDLRKRIMLTRTGQSSVLQRGAFSFSGDETQSESLLAAFLLGRPLSAETLDRFHRVKVVEQQWDEQRKDGRAFVELRVRFQTADEQHFSLSLQLDPVSKLPLSVQATDDSVDQASVDVRTVTLDYPDKTADELQAIHFPSNLSIVDASGNPPASDPTNRIASLERNPNPGDVTESDSASRMPESAGIEKPGEGDEAGHQVSRVRALNQHDTSVATLPIGAANKWMPVSVVPRTDAEVLQRADAILDSVVGERTNSSRRTGDGFTVAAASLFRPCWPNADGHRSSPIHQ